jgi:hypothetical protein
MLGRYPKEMRYSLKDVLVSITLVCVGLGSFILAANSGLAVLEQPIVLFPIVGGAALVGAGLFHPFKLAWLGAMLGVIVIIALLSHLVATTPI